VTAVIGLSQARAMVRNAGGRGRVSRIEVQELTKVYEGRKAVAGISFRVEAGELCVLL
jgi:hypothetical protein